MHSIRILTCFLFVYIFTGATQKTSKFSCKEIIGQMLDSISAIKTQRYRVKATERVDGHLLFAESRIKINTSPRKIYFLNPSKNIEVLWVQGSANALVHAGSMPMMNFNLDPYGSLMRKDQHHTIFDLGFQYVGTVIANTIIKAPKDFDKHFLFAGSITYENRDCYQIVINYPEYKYIEYVTGKGETVTSIAQKLNTSDFKIRHINDLSSYFGTIREGKTLKIPVPYANKAIVYIDKKTSLPMSVKIFDEEGLFESYDFSEPVINKPFAADEFLKTFKDYRY